MRFHGCSPSFAIFCTYWLPLRPLRFDGRSDFFRESSEDCEAAREKFAAYLVKAYAWRTVLDPAGGVMRKAAGYSPGFGLNGAVIVLAYLWLPYMALPIYAGLEKLPNSLLDASSDLGASAGRTFRSVVLPLLAPAIIAGAIFTFSLSLGDYIVVQVVGGKAQTIGNVIYRDFGASDLPAAAALATVPVLIMAVLLLVIRRSGALENL